MPNISPDILVIDSLNIVSPEERGEYFQQILEVASAKTRAIFFVLDSGATTEEHKFWEYVCDLVIRLDYSSRHDYYLRTIEVVKARYQEHVWGKHQFKVYAKPKENQAYGNEQPEAQTRRLRRAHPYRKEGGIFIYPSIHYYLSSYKRGAPSGEPRFASTKPDALNDILSHANSRGLPQGRCTAFIGCRGGHKSYLGYLHLLHRMTLEDRHLGNNEAGLVISLRDDEEMTRATMCRVLSQDVEKENPDSVLAGLEERDQLEILYFHPGYVTPEEFFHRVFISVQRLKRHGRPLTVLFNSLDQLSARFPLCAKEEIFVPGMIEVLSGENVTSIFIAVGEPGQPVSQYGLLPMADLVLKFDLCRFEAKDYLGHLQEASIFTGNVERDPIVRNKTGTKEFQNRVETCEEVVLQVDRFAGGKRAGERGLLELITQENEDSSRHHGRGLHFTKLNSAYGQGISVVSSYNIPR